MEFIRHRLSYFMLLWREGLIGKWGAAIWLLYGLFVAYRDELVSPADAHKWLLSAIIPHLSFAWWLCGAAAIAFVWSFEASHRLNMEAQAEIDRRSPDAALRIVFDPTDRRCVRPTESRYGNPSGEFYSILIENRGSKSLLNVSIRGLPSWFTSTILSTAASGHSVRGRPTIVLREIATLDPGATDVFEMFGLSYAPESHNEDHILNNVQTFTLEARARDTKTVSLALRYDRNARPMLNLA